MAAAPMRWWPDPTLARVAARLARAVDAWREAWGCAAPASVDCVRAHEWKDTVRPRPAPVLHAAVFDALFGLRPVSATGDELAADRLAEGATIELREALRAACLSPADVDSDAAAAPRARPWSGALIAMISCGSIRIVQRFDAASVAAMLAADGEAPARAPREEALPLATVAEALHARTVRIRTTLAAGELDLASLQSLALGDVIRLSHPLDRPLTVQADEESLPCAAYLGQRNGQRAIELARGTAHSDPGAAS